MKHIRPNLSIRFYLRLMMKLLSMIDENYSYPYYNTTKKKYRVRNDLEYEDE